MFDYAICEILGKQYKIEPNKPIDVDFTGEEKKIEASVLLLSEKGQLKVGNPYLKDKLTLNFLENIKMGKIRVAKYSPKANYRRVVGHRAKKTRVVVNVKK